MHTGSSSASHPDRRRPRIGLSLPNRLVAFGRDAGSLLDLAQKAEDSGEFESIWVGDGLLAKPRLEALVLLGALSQRTSRVRLGTLCLATFPLRDPVLLAIQLASVDRLSGGRLVVGVCAGPGAGGGSSASTELEAFGISSAERLGRLESGIARLRSLWAEPIAPAPVQQRIPILIGGTPRADARIEERVVQRVARLADGWQCDAVPAARVGQLWARMQSAALDIGRGEYMREVVVHVPVVLDGQRSEATATARAFIARNAGARTSDTRVPAAGAFGPPSRAVDLLGALLEAGATAVVRFTSDDQEAQLERLLVDVLPQLGRPSEA